MTSEHDSSISRMSRVDTIHLTEGEFCIMTENANVVSRGENAFHVLYESLFATLSLLRAVRSLPDIMEPTTDDLGHVGVLLKLADEHAGKAFEATNEGESAFNGLSRRYRWRPEQGDQIPPELVSGLVRHAIEANETPCWQKRAVEIGKMLQAYASIHPELSPLVSSWINFARKHGGDVRLHRYANGNQEITWHGSLKEKAAGSGSPEPVNG